MKKFTFTFVTFCMLSLIALGQVAIPTVVAHPERYKIVTTANYNHSAQYLAIFNPSLTDLGSSVLSASNNFDINANNSDENYFSNIKIDNMGEVVQLTPRTLLQGTTCDMSGLCNHSTTSAVSMSQNERYYYYIYNVLFYPMSTGRTSLIQSSVNNGVLSSNSIYNLSETSRYIDNLVAANNEGSVAFAIQNYDPNTFVATSYEIIRIKKFGIAEILATISAANFGVANIKINDLNTVFVQNFKAPQNLVAYLSPGIKIEIDDGASLGSDNMKMTKIVTPGHPEGVIYYLKNNKILISEGKTIKFESNLTIDEFHVASSDTVFFLASAGSNQYFMRNNEVLLSPGSILNGVSATSFADLRGNNRNEVTFSLYDNKPAPTVHLVKYSEKTCNVSDVTNKPVNFYSQVAPAVWEFDLLGFHKESDLGAKYMKAVGCVTTAYAMLFDYFGIKRLYNKISGFDTSPSISVGDTLFNDETNPRTLNKLFRGTTDLQGPSKSIQTYNEYNNVVAAVAAHAGRASFQLQCYNDARANGQFLTNNMVAMKECIERSKSIISLKDSPRWGHAITTQSRQDKMAAIEREICAGNPVLLRVERDVRSHPVGPISYDGHTVLATGTSYTASGDLTFIVQNPGTRNGKDLFLEDVLAGKFMSHTYPFLVGYDLFKPQADPSMITIYGSANLQFSLVDNFGRRAGFNPLTNLYYNELPGAVYSYEGIDPILEEGENETNEKYLGSYRLFLSENVQSGNYQITTYGIESGPGAISIYKTDVDGFNTDTEGHRFNVSPGSSETINFKHSVTPLIVNSTSLVINYSRMEKNSAKIYGQIILNEDRKVSCSDVFKFNLGAQTDINLTIPLNSFSKQIVSSNSYYVLDSLEYKVTISEKGYFWIDIKNLDLGTINEANKGRVSLSIGDQIGSANIVFKCNNGVCSGE